MEKRCEIPDKYKWDLSCYIKNEKMLNDELEYIKNTFPKFKDFYNQFNNKDMLYKYLILDEEYSIRFDRLTSFVYHSLDEDKANTYFIKLLSQLEFLSKQIAETTSFIYPQLLDLSEEYLNEIISDDKFKEYRRTFQTLLKNKPHKISEHDSELISKMSMFLGGASSAYDMLSTGEVYFNNFTVDGKPYEVTEANYGKLMANKNREVRKQTIKSLMEGYAKLNKTITTLYLNDIHEDIFSSKLHNFKSVKERCLFDEEVSQDVYDRLIKKINDNLPILHRIAEKKKEVLKLDEIAYYDMMVPITSEKKYTIEEAIELVKNATKPLGDEYQNIINRKFGEKVIDYLPNENKETGAYSSGSYGCPSIILMNFVHDLKSIYTLAHEMGHTMHSELSNMTQPFATSDYKIFVAEVASTVNELLLYNYLIKDADAELKKALVFDVFDEFRTTVFRQTMFSEFEDWIHEEIENENPKSYEDLNNYYLDLNKKYYGKNVILPDELKYEWSRIPHFYRAFYVYKYATGFISAVCIVKKILSEKDYYKKYINFLKSGSSKGVIDLLKDIEVDLTTDQPYNIAFDYLNEQFKLI